MNFVELRLDELRRIPLPRTPVNKPVPTFCHPLVRASSDKNHSFGGCAGCLEMLPFQGSGKEVKDCWDNRRAPKRYTMAADSENTLRESMGCVPRREPDRQTSENPHS